MWALAARPLVSSCWVACKLSSVGFGLPVERVCTLDSNVVAPPALRRVLHSRVPALGPLELQNRMTVTSFSAAHELVGTRFEGFTAARKRRDCSG